MKKLQSDEESLLKKPTEEFSRNCYQTIAGKLDSIMKQKGISQADLKKKCAENNYFISQGTLSRILQGTTSISLPNLLQICKALNEDITAVLSDDAPRYRREITDTVSSLIYRGDNRAFHGYFGTYHCYFYSTISSEDVILHGLLNLEKSQTGSRCLANLILETGKNDQRGNPIQKKYHGEMVISMSMNTAYCTLTSEEIGEICYFLFHYDQINYEDLVCRLALVATASAGGNRLPTVPRMLISRKKIHNIAEHYLAGQLLLNHSDILLSEENMAQLLTDPELPDYYRNNLEKLIQGKSCYMRISELAIRANHLVSSEDKIKCICLLRKYSSGAKYSKVGSKADEFTYQVLKKYKEPPAEDADGDGDETEKL